MQFNVLNNNYSSARKMWKILTKKLYYKQQVKTTDQILINPSEQYIPKHHTKLWF